jgi:hypothetical protein
MFVPPANMNLILDTPHRRGIPAAVYGSTGDKAQGTREATMSDDYLVFLREGKHQDEFLLNGGPISDPSKASAVFLALGHAAAAWSRLEQHIDTILLQVNKEQHSNEILSLYNPDHPRPFSDKIRLLKRYFNKHPALKEHKQKIRDFASAAKKMALERNEYIHSVIQDYDEKTQIVSLLSIQPKYDPDNPYLFRIVRYKPPLKTIQSFADFVNRANNSLEKISRQLFTENAVAQLRTP